MFLKERNKENTFIRLHICVDIYKEEIIIIEINDNIININDTQIVQPKWSLSKLYISTALEACFLNLHIQKKSRKLFEVPNFIKSTSRSFVIFTNLI
jgi:hypothetical protein